MVDESSIDQVLAGLDRLLNEDGRHRDDHPQGAGGAADSGRFEAGADAQPVHARPKKLLLSEAMLVDPPQAALPFDDAENEQAAPADAATAAGHATGRETSAGGAAAMPEPDAAWVDELARAVSERIAGALPALVDQVVREELAARLRGTPGGAKDSDSISGREDEQNS